MLFSHERKVRFAPTESLCLQRDTREPQGAGLDAGLRGPHWPPTRLPAPGVPRRPSPATAAGPPARTRFEAGTESSPILSPRPESSPPRSPGQDRYSRRDGLQPLGRSAPIALDLPSPPNPPTGRSSLTPEEQHQEEVGQPRAEQKPPPPPPQRHVVGRSRGVVSVWRGQAFPRVRAHAPSPPDPGTRPRLPWRPPGRPSRHHGDEGKLKSGYYGCRDALDRGPTWGLCQ